MNKIPTAEELFNDYSILICFEEGAPEYVIDKEDFIEAVKEFAKLHVKAALEAATKELPYDDRCNQDHMLKQSILNAYPESNIK